MALDTFGGLKTEVLAEMARTGDADLSSRMARFVVQAEQRIYRGRGGPMASEPLRLQFMETTATLTFTAGTAPLPANYLERREFRWPGNYRQSPTYQSPAQFWAERIPSGTSDQGAFVYTMEGTNVLISPAMSGSGTLHYFAKPAALVADGDTNWVLQNAPGIYFHAMLIEAYGYIRRTEKQAEELANYISSVVGLVDSDVKARVSGGRLKRRVTW